MTKKIFHSLCLVAFTVFLASLVLIMGVLYEYFSRIEQTQLRMQTQLAAQGVELSGMDYFDGLDIRDYRITWIDKDGSVLYDSSADSADMENHLEREEVRQALAEGFGESQRYSSTLMERSLYTAQRLEDGTVLRLAIAQNTVLTMLLGVGQGLAAIIVIALILSVLLAQRLSKRIVQPLNAVDLDRPLENEGYEEISPLLRRIDQQQKQLRAQEVELGKRQDELNAVTGSMKEGMVLLNPKGRILSMNQAAAALLETDLPAEGKDILAVSRDLDVQDVLARAGNGEAAEKYIHKKNGVYRLSASPVLSAGTISGVAMLMMDVTEKAQAETMRREFTANVSHELKTPLQTISGYAELIQNGMVRPEDVQPFAGKICAESQRMMQLISDIISLSHLDEGLGDMRFEDTDLYAVSGSVVRDLRSRADKAGVTLSLTGGPAPMRGIPQLIQSIVFNLCDNAIKYNREGGHVTVDARGDSTGAVLTVSDDGIGIPAEQQERIFERFYRVDKSRSKASGGTGLGLSIVKHAALVLGAEIELTSDAGKGTTVTVRFPPRNND